MDNKLQERRIIKSIFLIPIVSLFSFAILIFVALILYFHQFKKARVAEYEKTIINERKQETKNILLSVVEDINHHTSMLNKNIKMKLKNRIDEADSIINRIIQNNPNKSTKEIKTLIKEILSAIRFDNNKGYYFAYDKSTNIAIIHPLKKFLNKNMKNFTDIKGVNLINLFNSIITKKGAGYTTIYFTKPNQYQSNKEFRKIVYIKYIPKLNWVIGTGIYVNDALHTLEKNLLKQIEEKKYGKDGYFWVHSINYTLLAHPYRQKDIGKNDQNLTDIKGTFIIQKFIKQAMLHPKGTFITYYWKNPITNTIEKKISFVYYIPKFQWVIGTGLYIKDLEIMLQKRTHFIKKRVTILIEILFVILIITAFIISIISYILSKRTKAIFESYNNNLKDKIKEAIEENRKKDMMLQQQSKLAAMGEMISAIAHQWRQPLNSLALNLEVLLDKFYDNEIDKKYMEEFVSKQKNTIQFMSRTIDDFRNFFVTKEKERFSIKKSINEVIELIHAQLQNNNIKIEIKGDDFEVDGYKSEFKQVILNLINNAKDAIIETQQSGKITITLQNNSIIIQDTGKEIPKKIKDRIFEPYFTTKGTKGTGIGLYMSKMIIEKMGGEIYFQSPKKFIIKGLS